MATPPGHLHEKEPSLPEEPVLKRRKLHPSLQERVPVLLKPVPEVEERVPELLKVPVPEELVLKRRVPVKVDELESASASPLVPDESLERASASASPLVPLSPSIQSHAFVRSSRYSSAPMLSTRTDKQDETTILPGTCTAGETQLVIETNKKSYLEWKGYGLKLHVPENALPQKLDRCTVHIRALLSGHFELPPEWILVSAVYQIKIPVKFARPVTLEIQHCSSSTIAGLSFIVAYASKQEIPYKFKELEGGVFSSNYSYGSILLNHFCLIGIGWFRRLFLPRPELYCARLYRICQQNTTNWGLHFVITKNLDLENTEIRKKLEGMYLEMKVHVYDEFPIQFEDDEITLSIPKDGVEIEGWKISCLHHPSIRKTEVDNFRNAFGCGFHIHWTKQQQPVYFHYEVTLNGARPSRNYFIIIYPPLQAAAQPILHYTEGHSASSTASEMVPLDKGKETTQYKKVAAKYDLIIRTLSKTVSAETLAGKFYAKLLIGDDICSKARVAGVAEDKKIRPVIDAVLSKIELNPAVYDKFIQILKEFRDLEDLIECIEST